MRAQALDAEPTDRIRKHRTDGPKAVSSDVPVLDSHWDSMSVGQVLHLQTWAGNAAVHEFLQRQPAAPHGHHTAHPHSGGRNAVPANCRSEAVACFSVSQRRAWLLRPGRTADRVVAHAAAIGGRPGHETPIGHFTVRSHDQHHVSSSYPPPGSEARRRHGGAPMHYYVNFAPAVGFHEGDPHSPSHGCVHLSHDDAVRFYQYLQDGDPVDVVP